MSVFEAPQFANIFQNAHPCPLRFMASLRGRMAA